MPNCDFFALGGDSSEVLRFVLSQPGWCPYELYSESDAELRRFSVLDALLDSFDLGVESLRFQLWAPEMRGRVGVKRIDYRPGAVPGASYRYGCERWGLIQLYLDAPRDGRLSASHTNHNSETRARNWEAHYSDSPDRADDWDWRAVQRISTRLNRFIRSRGVHKLGSRVVLPVAHAAVSSGTLTLV